ncbi:RagB/SusD family nutrient uptake outer membrane protein [Chitinophaga tropicalis]|uniref:RagB/SusD family nutrient uptake outer membrane protein n=1 Tax=Chitinophaga tropicalis TaxID=2683588 RepID=A0A7K1U383_9BACT|nr:RagB/SusD family nutrient uptake outer membrane protein [Chitinophaga tropicalis]MVT08811.1 RagB/SusD family nutrient uptake outer membrane protein [Chitinophaga tropicalis]
MKSRNFNISGTILLLLIIFGMPSCKKWLDVQPSTRLDRAELFKKEEGYRDALAGVYGNLTTPALYGREMTYGTLDVLAGYYNPASVGSTLYYSFYNNFPYKRDNASRSDECVAVVDSMWIGMYNQVANLNSILDYIDGSKSIFSGDNYAVLKGETIGLRAFLHLDLLRLYGSSAQVGLASKSIPFVDTLSSLVSRLLTVEEASNRIINELQTALVLLENDPVRTGATPSPILASSVATAALAPYHNRRYHFNYYAVKAALARAYLWKGDKANALRYAKELIAEQASRFPWVLDANLTAINTAGAANKDRTFTTEHIFALNVRGLANDVPFYLSSAGAATPGNLLVTTNTVRNKIYENSTVDPRNQYLFTTYNSSFFTTKLYQDDATSTWFKYQVPVIRISEMYYIAAECEAGVSEGLNWLNVVRQARKLSPLTADAINTPATLMAEIQKEYQKEFIGEGQLWYFYKRLNYSVLPYSPRFTNIAWYVFDMPDNEYIYGGR